VEENWFEVEAELRAELGHGVEALHRHVFAEGGDHYYVQFAFGSGEVYAEAVSNAFLVGEHQLQAAAERKLRALGWLPPVRSVQNQRGQPTYPNWYRSWKGSRPPLEEIVEVTVRTLRDVYWVPAQEVRIWSRACDWCAGGEEAS